MATDCVDGGYLDAYARFFAEFVVTMNPDDQLPVKVSAYDVSEGEIVGEIISVTLQYLNQIYCPPSLQSYIVHLVIQAIKSTCKKQPEICGLRQQEKTYAPLKLMQAITNEVNEICRRYLRSSSLALLPPPSSTPQVVVGATRNGRRRMEDRHVVLHDLHTIFNIQDDTVANYYAVFDGHGGQDAAAYCATHLHQYLAESVHYPTDPERALRDAFLTTDAHFIEKSNTQKLNGGTTAVCVLILDKKLYVAWVGDSMACLVKRDCVKQLVNPHRPTRKDEEERILNMGGMIMNCVGVMRVNGFLSISRAIGDVPHKPYVTGEPEIRCYSLDGIEDFLIIACDGLWDHVDPRTAAQRVYRQVLQNPNDLKYVHQTLLQSAKCAGSLDNITVIVVFLTPPIEIASRPLNAYPLLSHPAPNGLLNNMDPNNPFLSNVNGQFDVNAAFVKQQKHDADLQHENGTGLDPDDNRLIYGTTSSNGKRHEEDADGNDDYDYGDLGPETDVDAVDDAPDVRAPLDRLSRELFAEKESRRIVGKKEDSNEDDDDDDDDDDDEEEEEDEDDLSRDNVNVRLYDGDVMDNRIRGQSDEDVYGVDVDVPRDNNDALRTVGSDVRVKHVEPDAPVDDDESPPSPLPRAAKPLQHALIPEADNVADSEDSEDEWNYYRIDPNKEESATAVVARSDEKKKNIGEKDSSEERSPEDEGGIKCERQEEEISSELIDTNISADRELSGKLEKDIASEEEKLNQEIDMDFQLNPNAAEFVPTAVSPTLLDRKNIADYPISGSPLKQTALLMDDIPVPSQREFEEEVCQRPREVDEKDYTNGDHDNLQSLDVSEISSTKAEFGDESVTRIMAATQQWQADTSQWSAKMRDDVGSETEEYDISTDPMAMSFAPGDFPTAFKKSVDLNAVHDLSGVDIDENESPMDDPPARSPEPCVNEDRAHTPLLDDKLNDLLHASSTPYDGKLMCETASESNNEATTNKFTNVEAEKPELTMEQLGIFPLVENLMENEVEKSDPTTLLIDEKLAQPVEDVATAAVSNLLDSPNLAESCAKESSPSTMSPAQDTLECTSPEPVEEDVKIPTIEPTEPVGSSLQPDVTELKSAQQYNFDQYASDFGLNDSPNYVMATCGSSIFKTPEEVSSTMPNIENLNFDHIEPALAEAITSADHLQSQQQHAWDMNVCAEVLPKECTKAALETFTNLPSQQETKEQLKSLPLEAELITCLAPSSLEGTTENADLAEDFARNEELCKLEADKMTPTSTDVDLMKSFNTPPSNMSKQEELTNIDEMKFTQNEKLCEIETEKTVTSIMDADIKFENSETVSNPFYLTQSLQGAEKIQSLLKDALPDTLSSSDIAERDREKAGEAVEVACTDVSKIAESIGALEKEVKQESAELLLDNITKANESKEKPVMDTTLGIVGTATAVAAATATAKTKTTTMTTKRTVKTTTTTTRTPTSTTKATTKSMPTSPSKTVSSTSARTTTTTSQMATAKKSTAARPKQLDGPTTKAAVSSSVGKTTAMKTTSKAAIPTTAKTAVSSRVNSGTTKLKTTASTVLPKSSTGTTEKKSTANGDVKSAGSKPATTKSTVSKTTTSSGPKTTLVKTSTTTRTSMSTVTSKPRPTSAAPTVKATSATTLKPATGFSSSSSRPKTAPISSTTKTRESTVKTTTVKSPMIDKQIKETANKQISLGRTGVSSTLSKTGRASMPTGTSTTIKSRTSTTRSLNTSATSPTKKLTATSKVATSKVGAKTASSNNKTTKPLSNGVVPESAVVTNNVITTTNDKLVDDDVPRKDASPVDVPTDNQLIVTAD